MRVEAVGEDEDGPYVEMFHNDRSDVGWRARWRTGDVVHIREITYCGDVRDPEGSFVGTGPLTPEKP